MKKGRYGLAKYLPNGVEELGRLECARITVGETEVVIHADEVKFEGTNILSLLQKMHQEIRHLRGEFRALEKKVGGGVG